MGYVVYMDRDKESKLVGRKDKLCRVGFLTVDKLLYAQEDFENMA